MSVKAKTTGTTAESGPSASPLSEPCIMLIFGASGDLTRRLLMPALYNLCCDGLLNDNFAVLGTGRTEFTDDMFRESMANPENGLRAFHTRKEFDEGACDHLIQRLHFKTSRFEPDDYIALRERVRELDQQYHTGGNILFYFALSPKFFGDLCDLLYEAGFQEGEGWKRIIVEKPFGTDLQSALDLNEQILKHWDEARYTVSTIISVRKRYKTCWLSGSRTACSNLYGITSTLIISSLTFARQSTCRGAVAITTLPVCYAT
jgi:glucose-6-phosphate 1-dehydrogenase